MDGLVENNRIEYSSGAGIYIGAHLDPGEAPNGKNIVIQNNHILHAGFGAFHSSIVNQGSIHLVSLNHQYNTVQGAYRNQNIDILNNVIEESARAGIYIHDAIDVNVIGNEIVNPNFLDTQRTYLDEQDKGITPFSGIILDNCKATKVRNNIMTDKRGKTKVKILQTKLSVDADIE